ncbi:MAG: hypothetical protein ACXWNK_02690 [Vulcanimicrobiaceae bacterium]
MSVDTIHLGAGSFCRYLQEALRPVAGLPASTAAPYLSAYFDWRPIPEHPNERSGFTQFEHEANRLVERLDPRGPAFESVRADIDGIRSQLASIAPSAQGAAIVACHARGVLEPYDLSVPLVTRLISGPTPVLSLLARVVDDYPPYAIVRATHHNAVITLMNQAIHEPNRPRFQHGSTEHRLAARHGELLEHLVRTVAAETERLMTESSTALLIIEAEDETRGLLEHAIDERQFLRDRLIGTIGYHEQEPELINSARPLLDKAARTREAGAVANVRELLGAQRAVAGAEPVVSAFNERKIDTLVINDEFHADGWADYVLGLYGAGPPPKEHPAGGNVANIVPVALEDEAIRLAILSDADIVFVLRRTDAAKSLADIGGIGAIVRWVE